MDCGWVAVTGWLGLVQAVQVAGSPQRVLDMTRPDSVYPVVKKLQQLGRERKMPDESVSIS